MPKQIFNFPDDILISFINRYIYNNDDATKININKLYRDFKDDLHLTTYNKTHFLNIIIQNYNLDEKKAYIILKDDIPIEKKPNIIKLNPEWLECINVAISNNLTI